MMRQRRLRVFFQIALFVKGGRAPAGLARGKARSSGEIQAESVSILALTAGAMSSSPWDGGWAGRKGSLRSRDRAGSPRHSDDGSGQGNDSPRGDGDSPREGKSQRRNPERGGAPPWDLAEAAQIFSRL
jgi:hypothetical protein